MINKGRQKKIIILSLAFNYHDSNIALSIDNKILVSLEIERLFRSKKIRASMIHMEIAARYLLDKYNLNIFDVDYLVVNALGNPFENKNLLEDTKDIRESKYEFLGREIRVFVVRHHVAHAGYYYFSNYKKALIASCDGGGDLGERVAYFLGNGKDIKRLNFDTDSHTSTKPYGQFSTFLYGEPFSEGKLMGLAGLKSKIDQRLLRRVSKIFPPLKNVDFMSGQNLLNERFGKYKGLARKNPKLCASLAACIQKEFVKRRINNLKNAYRADYKNLVIVGGSALNLECNSSIYNCITKKLYIPPNCDDTGIAVGQCAVIIVKLLNKRPICKLPFIGLKEKIENHALIKEKKCKNILIENDPRIIAKRLANNELCIRHFGRPEVGPRALGHRSFLMSPLDAKNKDIISVGIKGREWYRPLAPVIIQKDLSFYFTDGPDKSPFMLFSYRVKNKRKNKIPAVVHYDRTSRVQTINKNDDLFLYKILIEFKKITGVGVLINTSLNLKNQPLSNFLHDTLEIARKVHYKLFICLK